MFSDEEICTLLRSIPEAPEEIPLGLRTRLSYDEVLTAAKRLHARLSHGEWFFDPLVAMLELDVPFLIDFAGESFTTRDLIVLKHYPQCPHSIFDAMHEIMHWHYYCTVDSHGEGDAHLGAAELAFPHAAWESKRARSIVQSCPSMPPHYLASWAERWINHAQIPLVFPGEALHDPRLAKRMREAERRQATRARAALRNIGEFDASWLLPDLTG